MGDRFPRLYLETPIVETAAEILPALEQALRGDHLASVLLRFRARDEGEAKKLIRAIAEPVQAAGVALIIDGAPDLALRAGADGAHIRGAGPDLATAVEKLSPKYIAGAGGLDTRDEAMSAGEAGADYVLFGDGTETDFVEMLERVGWWAEIFNTPCVAFARTLDEVGPLTKARADFVMLGDCVWSDPRGPAAAIEDAAARLVEPPE
jgi:thiamine-phosphate pyrophosphorylase